MPGDLEAAGFHASEKEPKSEVADEAAGLRSPEKEPGSTYGSCGAKQARATRKKQEYYPLRPPRFVRPFIVFLPPLLLVGLAEFLLHALPCIIPGWLSTVVGVTAFLVGLMGTGNIAAHWQLDMLPTEDELATQGGRWFVRPSDGKKLEYFTSGSPANKTVVLLITRVSGTMGVQWMREQVLEELRVRDATLVCPSYPCIGASEPYDYCGAAHTMTMHTTDMIALLDFLGAENIYVMGMSWGAQPAFNLAEALIKTGRLRGVASLSGNVFNTTEIDYHEVSRYALPMRVYCSLFSNPIWARPLTYFFVLPLTGLLLGDGEKMVPAEEVADMKEILGDDLSWFGDGTARSKQWFLNQWWYVPATAFEGSAKQYVDFGAFPASIPVHLHHGKKDVDVPFSAQLKLKAGMPHAHIMKNDRGHNCINLANAVKYLFEEK